MARVRLIVATVLVFEIAITISSGVVFTVFSLKATSAANAIGAGTVALSDNDAGAAVLDLAGVRSGSTGAGCVAVTYVGTLPSTVAISGSSSGTLGSYVQLKVERGTTTASNATCTGFTPDTTNHKGLGAGVLYNGTLSSFPAPGAAISDPDTSWTQTEQRAYRFTTTVSGDETMQGKTVTGTIMFSAVNI